MSDETTQTGVQFDADLWQRFRENVRARKGGIDGHLRNELEQALRNYLDASDDGDIDDQLTRIEDRLDRLADAVSSEGKKKKDESLSSRTENRLDDIRDQIQDETDDSPKVHEEIVEMAIRENAGGSDPTIRRYKELLQQDRDLFPHPNRDRMYYRDPVEFVQATNAMRKGGKLKGDEYNELVDTYGEEWWLQQDAAADESDDPKGFR